MLWPRGQFKDVRKPIWATDSSVWNTRGGPICGRRQKLRNYVKWMGYMWVATHIAALGEANQMAVPRSQLPTASCCSASAKMRWPQWPTSVRGAWESRWHVSLRHWGCSRVSVAMVSCVCQSVEAGASRKMSCSNWPAWPYPAECYLFSAEVFYPWHAEWCRGKVSSAGSLLGGFNDDSRTGNWTPQVVDSQRIHPRVWHQDFDWEGGWIRSIHVSVPWVYVGLEDPLELQMERRAAHQRSRSQCVFGWAQEENQRAAFPGVPFHQCDR